MEQFGCHLSFNPDFASTDGHQISEIEATTEKILKKELGRCYPFLFSGELEPYGSDYGLHLIRRGQPIYLQIQVGVPRENLSKYSPVIHDQLIKKLPKQFETLRGHLEAEVSWVPIAVRA